MAPRDDDRPLNDLSPTERFSNRVSEYVRFRPDYPAAAIQHVLAGLAGPAGLTAADVGAGTGISARQLADRGVRVQAVEPNADMRAAATRHPLVSWHGGSAEHTGLPAGSLDLVLSAQAFHWFRQREAVAEFHRVLRHSGRLALMWNSRDRSDPVTRDYVEAIHAVQGEHPAERRPFDPRVVNGLGYFSEPVRTAFSHLQALDRGGLVGRAMSASYVPREGPAHDDLVRLLDGIFETHRNASGRVTMRYITEVWLSDRCD